ncbi:MAG: hypothetical protein ACJAZ1_003320 [Yoonia sp.]|jgi:hypothetical protein
MNRTIRLALFACLCPFASPAQEAEPGGVFFTFDIGQTFEGTTDRDLETTAKESGVDSLTSLSFGAITETRAQRLSFDLGTDLRISEGDFSSDATNVRLAYTRNSANAVFDVSLSSRREDIAFLRDASDFINDEGEIELPDDFDDLTGAGIRAETTLSASLRWGEIDPIGYSMRASLQTLRYDDASVTLVDSDTATLGFGLRLNINEVTTSNIDLSYSQTDEVGSAVTDTTTLGAALTFARPLGDLTTGISITREDDGDVFWSASVEREFALPIGSLRGELGLVEDESGDARLTGGIAFSFPRPTGQIDLAAFHSLSAGDDRATTTISASYLQDLSPISGMRVGFDFGQTSDSDGGDVLSTGSLSVSYEVSLTDVWQLNVGARANLRDDDGTRTRSNSVFLTLERPISWRP